MRRAVDTGLVIDDELQKQSLLEVLQMATTGVFLPNIYLFKWYLIDMITRKKPSQNYPFQIQQEICCILPEATWVMDLNCPFELEITQVVAIWSGNHRDIWTTKRKIYKLW